MADDDNQNSGEDQKVSMSQYVGVKEMLRKKEEALADLEAKVTLSESKLSEHTTKVQELMTEVKNREEQIKKIEESKVDPEEHKKVTEELTGLKTRLLDWQKQVIVDTSEGKVTLEDIKEFTQDQIDLFQKGLKVGGVLKTPKPDLKGGGGGDGEFTTGAQKSRAGWKELHPEGG